MSTDEQAGRASGSVPHAYRTKLFWHWAPAMPKGLPSGFVTVLYSLGSAADPSGALRFRDGQPIRVRHMAAAARIDEKDMRRYLDAAIAAGVLVILGERKRGRTTLYALVLSPYPDWLAAAAVLERTKRKRQGRKPPPWQPTEFGGPPPNLPGSEFGGPPPNFDAAAPETNGGTAPQFSSGDRPPLSSGDSPPNNPGEPMSLSHDVADLGEQPQDARGRAHKDDHQTQGQNTHDPQRAAAPRPGQTRRRPRCEGCGSHLLPIPGRPPRTHCHNCEAQERTA